MTEIFYSDGVGAVAIAEGVVRINFNAAVPGPQGKVDQVRSFTVALSIPGLLRSEQELRKVIEKLIEDGVLKKQEPASQS